MFRKTTLPTALGLALTALLTLGLPAPAWSAAPGDKSAGIDPNGATAPAPGGDRGGAIDPDG